MPDEYNTKAKVENALCGVFSSFGYERVSTSTLENYDVCESALGSAELKSAFKFADGDGSLVVMRPDVTMQVCRLAPNLRGGLNRVYYCLNSFENEISASGARSREFSQCGAELLGKSGAEGDIEAIELAVRALGVAGLNDFLIEIGHIGLFESLAEDAGLDAEKTKKLRALIDSKDAIGAEMFLKELVTPAASRKFLELTELFGDDAISRAQKFCGNNRKSIEALNELSEIADAADKLGIADKISFDLGLVRRHSYYNGLVLRGYARDYGLSLLDGGRYDRLSRGFGKEQAVGFCIGVDRVVAASGVKDVLPPADLAFICSDYAAEKAYIYPLREKYRVVKVFGGKNELTEYCKEHGVKCAAEVDRDGIKYVLGGEKCLP